MSSDYLTNGFPHCDVDVALIGTKGCGKTTFIKKETWSTFQVSIDPFHEMSFNRMYIPPSPFSVDFVEISEEGKVADEKQRSNLAQCQIGIVMVPAAEESGLKKLAELKSTLRSLAPNLCAYAIVISKADDAEGKDNTIAEADSEEIIKKYDFDDIVFLSTTAPRHVGYSAAGVMKQLLSQLHPKYQPSHWSETMRKRKRDFKMEARMRGDTPISQETNNKPSQCNLS